MKRLFLLVFLAAALAVSTVYVFSEDKPQGNSDSSQEVVVKGQLKIKIDAEMPDIGIKTDTNEVAQSIVTTEEGFLSISPEDVKDVKASLPDKISAERADYHANLSFLEVQPIFKITPKMASIDIDKWNFKVTDSTGGTVFLQKGEGRLPSVISWDGIDRDGRIMKMGSPYWYVLTYMDKAGNPGSVRRETPKEVTAIKYHKDNKLYIEVSSKVIFEEKRKERLTDNGKLILSEIQDYIKMSNTFPTAIQVYSDDKGISADQIRTLEKLFSEQMKVPKEFFRMEPLIDNSVPKNYRIIFIING
jgi:hypothetical protein